MLSFIEYLFESQIMKVNKKNIIDDELYHTTSEDAAINILKHNYFRVTTGMINTKGLSTTFDKNYIWSSSDVKFVLSFSKLKKKYKMIHVDEELGFDESEIKVLNDSAILDASNYIIRIETSKDKVIDLCKEKNIRCITNL